MARTARELRQHLRRVLSTNDTRGTNVIRIGYALPDDDSFHRLDHHHRFGYRDFAAGHGGGGHWREKILQSPGTIEQASHQRVDGHRHPCTRAASEESPVRWRLVERNRMSNGEVWALCRVSIKNEKTVDFCEILPKRPIFESSYRRSSADIGADHRPIGRCRRSRHRTTGGDLSTTCPTRFDVETDYVPLNGREESTDDVNPFADKCRTCATTGKSPVALSVVTHTGRVEENGSVEDNVDALEFRKSRLFVEKGRSGRATRKATSRRFREIPSVFSIFVHFFPYLFSSLDLENATIRHGSREFAGTSYACESQSGGFTILTYFTVSENSLRTIRLRLLSTSSLRQCTYGIEVDLKRHSGREGREGGARATAISKRGALCGPIRKRFLSERHS
ncbi:hypothetical protein EVAR_35843_1 [Eumeta japonica]|uniref:Uncharacterized protein n=1 Tax=Eumeta variegata TaxID=151549 RepID=A0A4C1WVZ9_EUMVA|nr:hypothetical protein EVAR_35843_1 [Eumeta japonica]